jgi:tetratricopeptide (TPR) repeat protein
MNTGGQMREPGRGKIVTFYSYKGGTGRTMALANTAWVLAQAGKKVLAVDWDLESPGLHKFFQPFLDPEIVATTPGIIELINDYSWAATKPAPRNPGWHRQYARVVAVSLDWSFPGEGELNFVSAGRQNREYSSLVTSTDWENFYERLGGGQFFDALRVYMKDNYDYVLIDSRTGLSDIAEICTVQMPDVLVDCFTLSAQSIEGAAAVARHIDEWYPNRGIRILPVPMRIENAENEKVEAGRAVARAQFDQFPRGMSEAEAARYWLAVEIPYRPFYAFEETLAVFGDQPGSPGSMLAALERLTAEISEREVNGLEPMNDDVRLDTLRRFTRRRPAEVTEVVLSYVSDDRSWADWIARTLDRSGFRVITRCADTEDKDTITHDLTVVTQVVALLSPSYVQSQAAREAWSVLDPTRPGTDQPPHRLIALRILDARLGMPFAAAPAVDLSGLDEGDATEALRTSMERPVRPAEHPAGRTPGGPRFPGSGANPAIWNVGTRNARFTGRGSVLEDLRSQLLSGSQAVVLPQALYGLGGVGKSQVALEYVHRFKADYDLVWWISAEQPDLISTALAELAGRLGLPVGESVVDAAQAARDRLRRGDPYGRWLLIFDNAGEPKELEAYLPGGDGHVLITSRNQAWSRVAEPLEVDVFTPAESVDHMMRRVPGLSADYAKKISTALGYLPLAVEQAAALLEQTGTPPDTYLERLEKQTAVALAALDAPQDYPASVASTWNLSFERLSETSPAAARMLELCAFFASDPISLDMIYSDEMAGLLTRYDDTLRERLVLGRVVRELSRFALAKVDQGNNSLQVHRLVQAVIRERMSDEERDEACHDVHLILHGAIPRGSTDSPVSWPKYDQILPHLGPSRAAACGNEETRQMLIDMVRYLWKRNDLARAMTLGKQLVDTWEVELGADHWQRLYLQSQLANVLRSQGQYEDARELDSEVFRRQRESATIGERHPHTWITAGGLAGDLRALGRFAEALDVSTQVYERLKDLLVEDDPRLLSAANNLAVSYRLVGDCFSARELDQTTLDRRRAVLGPDHPDTLLSASYLAQDLREAGIFATSVTMLRTTLQRYSDRIDDKTLEALRIAKSLAVSLRRAGERTEARELARQTCALFDEKFPETPDALAARIELASCMSAVGQKEEAQETARQVLDTQRSLLGLDHPYTLLVATNLSSYLRGTGQVDEAHEIGERARTGLVQTLGADHPYVLCCAVNVANALADMNRLDEAEQLEQATLRQLQRVLGEAHPDTLACQSNLAITLRAQGKSAEADTLYQDVLAALVRTLGTSHPSVAAAQEGVRLNRDLESQPI